MFATLFLFSRRHTRDLASVPDSDHVVRSAASLQRGHCDLPVRFTSPWGAPLPQFQLIIPPSRIRCLLCQMWHRCDATPGFGDRWYGVMHLPFGLVH